MRAKTLQRLDAKRIRQLRLLVRGKRILRRAPAFLGILLLIGAIYVVQREFRHLKVDDIKRALGEIPNRVLWISAGYTVVSYAVLTLYDRLGTIYAGRRVSYWKVSLASFCAYSLAHNLGFAAVSGAAVRYRLYAHWGLTPVQIGKVIAFCSLTFGLGGMVLGGAILLWEPESVPFFGQWLPGWGMHLLGLLMWAVVAGYVTLARMFGTFRMFGHEISLPGARMAVLQVLLATADVAVTAAIFYALLPEAEGLTYLRFLGVYLSSYTAGLAANLPGGLGVFDSAILIGLSGWLPPPQIVSAILVFRLYYYIIPLFVSGALFAGNEILLRGRKSIPPADQEQDALPAPSRWSAPDLAVGAATGAVALSGSLLLGLNFVDPNPDLSWLGIDAFDAAREAEMFFPSLLGTGLLVMAVGLAQRVRLAWGMTILLLLSGAAVSLVRGEGLWVSAVLILTGLLLAPFREAFYRQARSLRDRMQAETVVPLFALVICLLMLAGFERHVSGLAGASWWSVVLSADVPNAIRASVAGAVFAGLAAIWGLIRPAHVTFQPWTPEWRMRCARMNGLSIPKADGVVLGEAAHAGIPFCRVGSLLLGLGDPTGPEADRVSAVWHLRDLASQEGRETALWGVGETYLQLYADLGLQAVPLDKDGLPLSGGQGRLEGLYLVCRAERDLQTILPALSGLMRPSLLAE
ncbi:putative bifunctional lysylphosphatidylglycerol flippase/synthetase [Granulibacter bethesdensis]|uniref:lysylphosphatidylglycerol synthetase family protein n=1 Tax=Granulibacter bethesdensis TaxID=364410 RepID=UPI00090B0432|nr:lysylphosphatidylglycerol synthetase family protein [Granulibacter bethesdensis]APH60517.1 Transporter [Granulibacter bethesdensis]